MNSNGRPTVTTEAVTLRGGLRVSLDALRLLWSIEDGGLIVRVRAAGAVAVEPAHQMTDAQRDGVGRHRREVLALVRYCDRIGEMLQMSNDSDRDQGRVKV